MKKIIILVSMLLLVLSLVKVEATIESGFLPGGKNYLDYNNFTVTSNTLTSNDSIRVLANTTYTITLPSMDLIGATYIHIYGGTDYIDNYTYNDTSCREGEDITICTFTTIDDQFIDIHIQADMIGLYDGYYQFDKYQLEEGAESTTYETYIAPITDTTSPEFNATGAYITTYTDTTSAQDIVTNHVFAFDEVDGDVSTSIVIETDNYTPHIGTTGSYSIILSATDSSNNKSYFELVVIVKDEIIPNITGPETVDVDVDDRVLIDTIISSNYLITDDYDGTLSYTITTDNYTGSEHITGSYTVTINTIDTSLNETSKTITINVKDIDAPLLESNSEYNTNVSYLESLTDIVNTLVFTDNYDSIVSSSIVTENYSGFETTIGVYFVDVLVEDSSFNQATYTITIRVIDDVNPTITGTESISSSYLNPPTQEEILALLTVSDNHDTLSTSNLYITSETYLSRTSDLGQYYITYEVQDSALNKTSFTININLVDDQAPVIFVDNYIVKIDSTVTFTVQDAVYLMYRNDLLEEDDYEVEVLINEYKGHEDEQGMYLYQVEFTNKDGETFVKDFVIEVLTEEQENYSSIVSSGVLIIAFTIFVIIKKKK